MFETLNEATTGWLTAWKIPVGDWSKAAFDWLQSNGKPVFDLIRLMMEAVIDGMLWVMMAIPPVIMVALFMGLTWYLQRSWKIVALVGLGFLFIINQGYWPQTMESMTLILLSCATCMAIGVPVGIACAHRPKLYAAISPVLDLMQTLPTFVYLIPAIVFFGLGMVPGLIATVIFVLPAPIRLTYLGVASTPTALMEAATAFGATPSQRLWKVELPYALPQIMAGMTQAIMLSLSMVVIAAMVGANGLGVPVVRALNSVNTKLGFESGFIIVVVAILLDRMLKVTRK
jgi:glycine betaine/proline transport system permease protein